MKETVCKKYLLIPLRIVCELKIYQERKYLLVYEHTDLSAEEY